jgi:hypothetical protein
MLAIITPVLGAAMIMMALDRHWQTTFFWFCLWRWSYFISTLILIFWSPRSVCVNCTNFWVSKYGITL